MRRKQPISPSTTQTTRPRFVEPMTARPVQILPDGGWHYEVKFDGWRAQLVRDGPKVELRSRNDRDLSQAFPSITTAGLQLRAQQAVLDGEIVALDANGRPSFQALQNRGISSKQNQLVYYAFDVLFEGQDTIGLPLEERRAKLSELIEETTTLRISHDLPGTPTAIVAAVKGLGLEGVVAKRRGSVYVPGARSQDWLKLKFEAQQEFVLGGYRPDGERSIDTLVVGYYEGTALRFAAKVRAGFVTHSRRELAARVAPLKINHCPFDDLPTTGKSRWGAGIPADEMRTFRWVQPALVAQIRFREWTTDGRLRHASYLGLRTDKSARDVVRES